MSQQITLSVQWQFQLMGHQSRMEVSLFLYGSWQECLCPCLLEGSKPRARATDPDISTWGVPSIFHE